MEVCSKKEFRSICISRSHENWDLSFTDCLYRIGDVWFLVWIWHSDRASQFFNLNSELKKLIMNPYPDLLINLNFRVSVWCYYLTKLHKSMLYFLSFIHLYLSVNLFPQMPSNLVSVMIHISAFTRLLGKSISLKSQNVSLCFLIPINGRFNTIFWLSFCFVIVETGIKTDRVLTWWQFLYPMISRIQMICFWWNQSPINS